MRGRLLVAALLAAALSFALPPSARAVDLPPSFAVDDAAPGAGFVLPTQIAFLPDGRFFVAEKRGRVYEVRGGIKQPTPIWSGENEVLNNGDRGLIGLAVDPNYFVNHYLYLVYTVEPDSSGKDTAGPAFSRLTRYQVNFTDSAAVIPSSRTILMGVDWPHGPISASSSHTIGALHFGRDGSLLVASGDGAEFNSVDLGGQEPGGFGAGKTDPNEDIGAFRSQYIGSLAGKYLRINPANGHGYASNPYANSDLTSPQSKVWVYGLRNPFRFTVRPGTGVADTAQGKPGTLYIGDVGWNTWEEMNVARTGGINFGWPCYEGFLGQGGYQSVNPAHNGCGSFGTPTNPAFATAPTAAWNHGDPSIGSPPGFSGNCSVGGAFYTSNAYPTQYRGQYFFADYGQSWIKVAVVDANDNLLQVLDFAGNCESPVNVEANPVTGDIYYISISAQQVRRVRWTGPVGGNTPPVASMSAVPTLGAAPLNVNFSASGSSDADGDPMTFTWLFGDGTGASGLTTSHTYSNPGIYTAQLTVADNKGGIDVKTTVITANPPGTAFPAGGVLDNFNRPDGPVGGSWVDQTAGMVISNNGLTSTNTTNTSVWNGGVFGANQDAYFTFRAINLNAPEHNIMLKVQGTTWSTGHIEVNFNAPASRIYVNTYAPGQNWIARGSLPITFAPGDQFGARADSLGMVTIFKNGGAQGQISVGDWPFAASGGRIGLTLTGMNGSLLDDFGGGTVVPTGNTRPTAQILAPPDNSFYWTGETINLSGTGTDAETPSDSLTYGWTVDLHHNNHVHPSIWTFSGPTASFVGANHDDGTGVYMVVKFTATDPQGLVSDTARVTMWPEIDLHPSAVTVSPDPPIATQSAQFSFKFYNSGRMPAPFSHWVLRAGGAQIAAADTIVPALDSIAVSVSAVLPATGTFALRLTADSLGAVHETDETNNVSVRSLTVSPVPGNHPPVAVASGTPASGPAPLTVSFTSAGSSDPDSDPLSFGWAFGDGATGSGATASHAYAAAGTYVAILTASDGRGGADTASVPITVTPPPDVFPQTAVLDNFNRANGPVGGSWVDGTSGLTISSNQLAQTASDNSVIWNGATFGAAQEAYITFATASASAAEQNLMLKVQGTTWSTGIIEIAYNAPQSRITVNTYAPTQGWVGHGQLLGVTLADGDRFGARADSLGNVAVYRNGTKLGTLSVAGWPFAANGGHLGLALSGASGSRFDDFGGGTVTGAPPVLPDLQVSAVSVSPDPAIATQTAAYTFKLYNRGAAAAATSHWVLRAGATLVGQGDNALNAGDSASLAVNAALPSAGTYTLRLTADSLGAVTESNEANNSIVRSLTVNPLPGNHPPVAVAAGSPGSGLAPLTVNFTGAGSSDPDGDPLTYSWAFGDGGTGSGLTTSHAYTTAGSFAAILTVTDGRGGSDTAGVPVTVTAPPVTFPLTAVLDDFNRANGGVGAPWTPTTGLTISSNQLKPTNNSISSVWNGATFGPNQEAYVRLNAITSNSPEHNLMLKVQGTVWSTGFIEVRYDNQRKNLSITTYDPAVGWVQRGANLSLTLVAGDQFGARALSDGTITVYKNGNLVNTVSAAGWAFNANGGRVGLTLTRTTSSLLDDFGGGTVSGPAPSAALAAARDGESASPSAPGPATLALSNPFPNPASGTVTMALDLPRESDVSLSVFDVQGREVWSAGTRHFGAGRWTLVWPGATDRGVAPVGLYLARVRAGGETFLRRIALLR